MTNWRKSGRICAFLTVFLAFGCGSRPPVEVPIEVIQWRVLLPPELMFLPVGVPQPQGQTNDDMARWITELYGDGETQAGAVNVCNAKLERLYIWLKDAEQRFATPEL